MRNYSRGAASPSLFETKEPSMRSRGRMVILLLPLCALIGCGGESSGDPSISGVTPNRAYLARTTEVTISGFATHWNDAAEVDFGAGIDVVRKIVASPTGIVAT